MELKKCGSLEQIANWLFFVSNDAGQNDDQQVLQALKHAAQIGCEVGLQEAQSVCEVSETPEIDVFALDSAKIVEGL